MCERFVGDLGEVKNGRTAGHGHLHYKNASPLRRTATVNSKRQHFFQEPRTHGDSEFSSTRLISEVIHNAGAFDGVLFPSI